jgi:hypothetical protein
MALSAEGLEVIKRERGSRHDRNIETRAMVDEYASCIFSALPIDILEYTRTRNTEFWNIHERGILNFSSRVIYYRQKSIFTDTIRRTFPLKLILARVNIIPR